MFDKHYKKENPTFTGITRGIGGFGFGVAAAAAAEEDSEQQLDYFITTLNRSVSDYDLCYGVAVGSDDSIYGCGGGYGAGGDPVDRSGTGVIFKLSPNGVLQWQREIQIGGTWNDIILDSNDNVYVCGDWNGGVGSGQNQQAVLAKLNSSGTTQWIRSLTESSNNYNNQNFIRTSSLAVDSSGYIIMMGYIIGNATAGQSAWISKWDSSGSLQWSKIYNRSGNSITGSGVITDSSNNIFICGQGRVQNNYYNQPFVGKLDSSGNPQWYSAIIGPYDATYGNTHLRANFGSLAFDYDEDNIYAFGRGNRGAGPGTQADLFIVKYNSSGVIQWHKFTGTSSFESGYDVAVDDELADGKIYLVGDFVNSPNNYTSGSIVQFNKNGNFRYRRSLRSFGLNDPSGVGLYMIGGIVMDSGGNLIVGGYTNKSTQDPTNGNTEIVVAKLPPTVENPPNGGITGTYGDFVYENPTHTTSNSSLTYTNSNYSNTGVLSSLQEDTSSYTFVSGTPTNINEASGTNTTAITIIQEPSAVGISTTDLDIYLDANNYTSYSGASSKWKNLSTSGVFGDAILRPEMYHAPHSLNSFGKTSNATGTGYIKYFTNLRAYIPVTTRNYYYPYTYSVWMYVNSTAAYTVMLEQGDFEHSFELHNTVLGQYNPLGGYWNWGGAGFAGSAWYNVSMTVDVTGSPANNLSADKKIYVDGVLKNSNSFSGQNFMGTFNGWSLGSNTVSSSNIGSSSYQFQGRIGSIAVYNRALTASEILSNYNATKATYDK